MAKNGGMWEQAQGAEGAWLKPSGAGGRRGLGGGQRLEEECVLREREAVDRADFDQMEEAERYVARAWQAANVGRWNDARVQVS